LTVGNDKGLKDLISNPKTFAVPSVGVTNPVNMLNKVDFPAPFLPKIAVICPS